MTRGEDVFVDAGVALGTVPEPAVLARFHRLQEELADLSVRMRGAGGWEEGGERWMEEESERWMERREGE